MRCRMRWEEKAGAVDIRLTRVELNITYGPGPVFAAIDFSFHCIVVRKYSLYYFYPFKFIEVVLWLSIWSILENDPRALEKNIYSW